MTDPLGLIPNASPVSTDPTRAAGSKPQEAGDAFREVLMKELEQVNRLQKDAEQAIEDIHTGKRDDLDAVVIAKNQADIAFQLLLQVRNKMMDAYEEVKQIRV